MTQISLLPKYKKNLNSVRSGPFVLQIVLFLMVFHYERFVVADKAMNVQAKTAILLGRTWNNGGFINIPKPVKLIDY